MESEISLKVPKSKNLDIIKEVQEDFEQSQRLKSLSKLHMEENGIEEEEKVQDHFYLPPINAQPINKKDQTIYF